MKIHDEGSLIHAFIGRRGTGKTTRMKKVSTKFLRSGGRVLVIPSSPYEPTFKSMPRIKLEQISSLRGVAAIDCKTVKQFGRILNHCDDLMIIADDMKSYMPEGRMDGDVRQALISSRHRNVQLLFAVHGWTQIPPDFMSYIDVVWLHGTTDSLARHREKFRDVRAMEEGQDRVNKKAQEDPYYCEIINNQV